MQSEENKSVVQKIKDKARIGTTEHLLNIYKAVIGTAPFCGGIVSLMTDYISNSIIKRLEEFTEQLSNDLDQFKDRLMKRSF